MPLNVPRLVIAGLCGDSGKTIASLSLVTALRQGGRLLSVFKKGPDYIDSAWLSWAAGTTCRNLDTYLVDRDMVRDNFCINAAKSDVAVIEGNRGLYDGKDVKGTHSTAALAELLHAPVVLVVNAAKSTRTVAAVVKGCQDFDPKVNIAGVILNRVAGQRHANILVESIQKYCEIPVLGKIPYLEKDSSLIPGRHLGLKTPSEFEHSAELSLLLGDIAEKYLDLDRIIEISSTAGSLPEPVKEPDVANAPRVRIGYFKDSVFTFYYPENLEALRARGAELVPVSSLEDTSLPEIDALYIGGGFPETHAERLARNKSMMDSVRKAAENDLPIYAECGGLIYLSRSLTWDDQRYPMAGLFPLDLEMSTKPIGHGYTELKVDHPNPFFKTGTVLKGHEFHYSGPASGVSIDESCMKVKTGHGLGKNRDGLLHKSTLACYTHIHADGVKDWAPAMITCAERFSRIDGNQNNNIGGSNIRAVV